MAQAARKIDTDAPTLTDEQLAIIAEVAEKPSAVLVDEKKLNLYLSAIRAQIELEPGDMSTAKGRDIIKANAAGVARKKTAIDNARKALTENWRQKTAQVNAVGKIVVEKFDALRDEIRAPLTEYEAREEARKAEADRLIEYFRQAGIVRADETAADVQVRLDEVRGNNLNDELFGARLEMAVDLRDDAIAALQAAIERIKAAEAERAELQRLRDEAEARRQADEARAEREREEQAAKERAEREAAAAEEAKQAEAARIERARQEAVEQAQREAEAKAERERQEAAAAAQAKIDAANARAAAAEREAQAERDRVAAAEQARKDEEARLAAEQAQREADLEHRSNVMRAAKEALMNGAGLNERAAKTVVLEIAAGNIPAVSITF